MKGIRVLYKRPAFTLIETMLYITISSLLIILTMKVVAQLQTSMITQRAIRSVIMQNEQVLDLIQRDLISTQSYDCAENKLILLLERLDKNFQAYQTWVAWIPDQSSNHTGIKRIEGHYHEATKTWLKKLSTLHIPCTIETVFLKQKDNENVLFYTTYNNEKIPETKVRSLILINKNLHLKGTSHAAS